MAAVFAFWRTFLQTPKSKSICIKMFKIHKNQGQPDNYSYNSTN